MDIILNKYFTLYQILKQKKMNGNEVVCMYVCMYVNEYLVDG